MREERRDLVDLLLGELDPARAAALERRLAAEPALRAERDRLARALGLAREAAAEGWGAAARPGRWRLRAAAVAAAAALLLAAVVLVGRRGPPGPAGARVVFEPAAPLGWLLPEETGADGRARPVPGVDAPRLAAGTLRIAPIGGSRAWPVGNGEPLAWSSGLSTGPEEGARIDLPRGAVVFLAPASSCLLRRRDDGDAALRLTAGALAVAASDRPVHLAVEGTGLLLRQRRGACLLTHAPGEASSLRGTLVQVLSLDETFPVPAGERLPAACVDEPRTVAFDPGSLELGWYRDLAYAHWREQEVALDRAGRSGPLRCTPDTLVFVECRADGGRDLAVSFGGAPRRWALGRGAPLRVRVPLHELGDGPRLRVEPPAAVARVRVFEAVPR